MPIGELLTYLLLPLGVVVLYTLLKLHYIFAFKLVANTKSYEENRQKYEKIQKILFLTLKVLLFFGLFSMFSFEGYYFYEGYSLEYWVINLWHQIPQGFWIELLYTLIRIAIMIVIFKTILKKLYGFLQKKKDKIIAQEKYKKEDIESLYKIFTKSLNYIVVFGIIYRITLNFPFLSMLSLLIGYVLIAIVLVSVSYLTKEYFRIGNNVLS